MQFLIPMAGAGRRFKDAGYRDPKPFINVHGRPMVVGVISDLVSIWPSNQTHIVAVHGPVHSSYVPWLALGLKGSGLVTGVGSFNTETVEAVTEGAACTCLIGTRHLYKSKPLVIANSDQRVECPKLELGDYWDAAVLTFRATESKWSYAVLGDDGMIEKIVEKPEIPPSSWATCGIYYFSSVDLFEKAAKLMISKNDRTNGEFYLAPCFNYLSEVLGRKARILNVPVVQMHGLGTPEDLDAYLNRSQG